MALEIRDDQKVPASEVFALFDRSDFPDFDTRFSETQVGTMLENSNLIVTAHDEDKLVGVAVSMTNFVSVCFLVLFAVDPLCQRSGIGRSLIDETHNLAGGDRVSFVTVSTPDATGFYEKIGLERCRNAYIAPRRRV